MRPRFHAWTAVAAALLLAVTVAGSCGSWHWLPDLASHFRSFWLLAAVGATAVTARRPRSIAFACSALAVAGNAWAMLPFWLPAGNLPGAGVATRAATDAPSLELVLANVRRLNPDKARAVAYLRDRRPDVAVILEVDSAWAARLSTLDDIYPFRLVEPRTDNFGLAVLSRWPLAAGRVVHFGGTPFPNVEATVRFHDREVTLFATHPYPPYHGGHAAAQAAQLAGLAAAVVAAPRPCVVAGDFNATPWSWPYRAFTAASGLRDTALGRGVQPTWNARLVAPRIPIDHVFASPDVVVLRRAIGPDIGSDHFPVEATLALPPTD